MTSSSAISRRSLVLMEVLPAGCTHTSLTGHSMWSQAWQALIGNHAVRLRRPSRVSIRSTALHSVRGRCRRLETSSNYSTSRITGPSTTHSAGHHERQRRHTSPWEARQLLGCCHILVPEDWEITYNLTLTSRRPSSLAQHLSSNRLPLSEWSASLTIDLSVPMVWLTCQRCSKGTQLPHACPTSRTQSAIWRLDPESVMQHHRTWLDYCNGAPTTIFDVLHRTMNNLARVVC